MHGLGITHIDALCHMFVRGEMYNGFLPADVRSNGGALRNSIMAAVDGLVGRCILIDVPVCAVPFQFLPAAPDRVGGTIWNAAEDLQEGPRSNPATW